MKKCEGERKNNLDQSEMWQYIHSGKMWKNIEKREEDERRKENIWRGLEDQLKKG